MAERSKVSTYHEFDQMDPSLNPMQGELFFKFNFKIISLNSHFHTIQCIVFKDYERDTGTHVFRPKFKRYHVLEFDEHLEHDAHV